MEVEGRGKTVNGVGEEEDAGGNRKYMGGFLSRALTGMNCFFLGLGLTGGPIMLRLYYLHGGSRMWLASWLELGGWPILLLPLGISYMKRRRDPKVGPVKIYYMTYRPFIACSILGVLTGLNSFLYAYGLKFLPVSTSSILVSTQLVFTAVTAFFIVKQRFTAFSVNAVTLLTVGALMLGLHASGDRPAGVSNRQYYMGFFLTLGAAALNGVFFPLVELTYNVAKVPITYTLVMEMQVVISIAATIFNTIGALINKDFQAVPREARNYGLGEVKYYVVLVISAIFWQFNILGTIGVIFCVNTLLAGILTAVFIPITGVLGVIFFDEKFTSDKGVSLFLSLWGLVFYLYGDYKQSKKAKPVAHQPGHSLLENP